ncbi:MAG: AAA domain-containing protein [Candidatus Eisenbacteria bacterium]|nr:AAA domain-containing protein [Candidatus Eisenbacteria bacterium]
MLVASANARDFREEVLVPAAGSTKRTAPRPLKADHLEWPDLCARAQVLLSSGAWPKVHDLLWPNLRRVWQRESNSPSEILALGLALTACTHLDHTSHLRDGVDRLRRLVAANTPMSSDARAYCIYHVSRHMAERGMYSEARSLLEENDSALAEASPHPAAYSLMVLARVCARRGDLEAAARASLDASVLASRSGSDVLMGDALIGLGSVSRFRRELDSAQRLYARAASCYWKAGDFIGRSVALVNRAALLNGAGLLSASMSVFREALEAAAHASRPVTDLRARLGVGWVSARAGDLHSARRILLSAWRHARRLHLPREEALALEYLSECSLLARRLPQARVAIRLCTSLAERIAPDGDIALEIKIKEATLCLSEGDPRRAARRAGDALRHAERTKMRWEAAQALRVLGVARAYAGQKRQRARSAFVRARDLLSEMGEKLEIRAVEAWIEALDAPRGWLPGTAKLAPDSGEREPVTGDDLQARAVRFWLDHPLLGPHAWLRKRARIPVGRVSSRRIRSGITTTPDSSTASRPGTIRPDPPVEPLWADLGLVSRTPLVLDLLRLAETYARGKIPVLILGETGSGKDLIAQGLHRFSGRTGRFVPVNCAAAHRELFVAELFGSRRGAYTGASESRGGLIREAEGGTLFLDEIADLDAAAQGYLLRFLDSGEVRPLGESRSFKVETRVVAATCRDLAAMVREGLLRRDLYARLAAAVLQVPPLRERLEDLELLIEMLWRRAGGRPEDWTEAFTPAAIEMLRQRTWPGNVRDLAHLVAQTQLFVQAGAGVGAVERVLEQAGPEWDPIGSDVPAKEEPARPAWVEALSPAERRRPKALHRARQEAGGSIPRAARLLGISRTHAYRLYKQLS